MKATYWSAGFLRPVAAPAKPPRAPKPASKDKLLQALTGWDKEITPNAVEVYVSRLRGKLEPHGVALRSIRGFGYRLELAQQA